MFPPAGKAVFITVRNAGHIPWLLPHYILGRIKFNGVFTYPQFTIVGIKNAPSGLIAVYFR